MAGILTSAKRPRNLTHWHAGPLLFGDWGTSRLYVLGIGAVTLGLAAPYYLLALSVLMVVVAWAYTIVCRLFQDGGGVYSAARQLSPLLAVIGATLLLGNYIVTASLSTVEAFVWRKRSSMASAEPAVGMFQLLPRILMSPPEAVGR